MEIGDKLLDNDTKNIETIVDKTANSYCITRTKLTKEGINCTQWFSDNKWFQNKFKII